MPSAEAGVAAFDAVAATYDDWFETPLGSYVDGQERAALARLLDGLDGDEVVEIGAGTGHVASWLDRLGFHVKAVEPSTAMRTRGRERAIEDGIDRARLEWIDARAEALPFDAQSFAGAVFFTSLEFVSSPNRALAEARRVVRSGGWLAIGFLHALSPWAAMYRRSAERGRQPWSSARFYVTEDLEALVGQPADRKESVVHLAPGARAPFEEADRAGKRAGNPPAMQALLWRVK